MGGRGSFAQGNEVELTYKNTKKIEDVWAVEGIEKRYHSLPEESHKSSAYIKLSDGIFKEMRIYDENHLIKYKIAYHAEPSIDNSGKKVFHIHYYNNGERLPATNIPNDIFYKYKKYFIGVNL